MTDAVAIEACPPETLLRLEIWGDIAAVRARAEADGLGDLPEPGQAVDSAVGRLFWIEPGAWMVRAPLDQLAPVTSRLETLAGDDGAVIDITGGLARHRLIGTAWRELLTIGGVFDVENPAFAPGRAAATILHHAAIWIDVITGDSADIYSLPSYAQELAEGWARAITRLDA